MLAKYPHTWSGPRRVVTRCAPLIVVMTGCVELPPHGKQMLSAAEQDYRAGNHAGASAKCEDILRAFPEYQESANAYYLRALCRIQQNNRLGAANDVKKCIALSNNADLTARAHATGGTLAFEAGNFAEAAKHFEQALKRLPEKPPTDLIRYRYGLCLAREGDWRKARTVLAMVIQRYPDSGVAPSARAMFEWPYDYFVIQCGAFRDRAAADKEALRLAAAGLPARVESRPRLGEVIYMVCVGNYPKLAQAQDALRSVKAKHAGAVIAPSY